jgi:hypothetical protein
LSSLGDFRKATRGMRTILANVPTYMLFDDHDVTDDWNLDLRWTANLTPLGKSVVGSAMAVYATFQNWGNRKDSNLDPAVELIEKFYSQRAAGVRPARGEKFAPSEILRDLLNMPWSFSIMSSPRVVFLDTRTKREMATISKIFSIGADFVPAIREVRSNTILAGDSAIANLSALSSGAKSALIIATPTPVFSHFYVESLKSLLVSLEGAFLPEEAYRRDVEDWQANPESLFRFIDALAALGLDKFLVLSGDVHYSFQTRATVTIGGKRKLELLQLCSSAMSNELDSTIQKIVRSTDRARNRTVAWWWKPGDPVAGCLVEPSTFAGQFDVLKQKFGGEPNYLIELEVFPLDWFPPSAGTASVQFLNSIGRLSCLPDRLQGMHMSPVGNGIHKSRTVDLMLK